MTKVSLQALLSEVISELRSQKLTLGFAESCTGGRLSASLTAIAGVSDLFMGAVVSYSYQAKVDLLGVSWETLKSEGAVSQKVVEQMALGCQQALGCTCSVAITGIAGPGGGTADKPVGTVWFAVSGPFFDKGVSSEKKLFSGDREQVQQQSVEFALEFLLNSLRKQ